MPLATAFAIFLLMFAVLPWGIKSQHELEGIAPGTDRGAPSETRVGWKLLWTTVVAIAIYAVGYFVYAEHWITINGLMSAVE
jgi:predicted secreted protein